LTPCGPPAIIPLVIQKLTFRRRLFFSLLTPVLTVLALFLLLEAGLRVGGYNPLKPYTQDDGTHQFYLRESDDPHLRYELYPGYAGRLGGRQIGLRINKTGLRGHEIDADKGGRFRLAILGDSVAFAKETEEADTFADRLEAQLGTIRPGSEALNFGVEGYDTLEEVIHFKKVGRPLKPDVVVLCFCLNDIGVTPFEFRATNLIMRQRIPFWFNSRALLWISGLAQRAFLERWRLSRIEKEEAFAVRDRELFIPVEPDAFEKEQAAKIAAMQAFFDASTASKRAALADRSGRLWLHEYESPENLGKIRYAFKELRALADADGFKALVAILPFFYRIDGVYLDAPAHAIIGHEAALCGLPVLDLYGDMAAEGLETLTLDSVHLNVQGHRVMARLLFDAVRSWIPAVSGGQGRP
jgi:lysophospholipase L1-like esterase